MNESFLAYIWETKQLPLSLLTTDGTPIEILSPGIANRDAGPDFFNAGIIIGETRWAGNVEIHVKSSDWLKHKHNANSAYDNIILHLVFENDITLNIDCPTLELKEYIPNELINRYQAIINSSKNNPICCSDLIRSIDPFLIGWQIERMFVERLRRKTDYIIDLFNKNDQDWTQTFYTVLMSSFGFKINALPFELLARSTPFYIINQYSNSSDDLQALLFGQAGMLNDETINDDYYTMLNRRYTQIKLNNALCPIDPSVWKFARIYPKNFPTIRIAQLASLLTKSNHLFEHIINAEDIASIKKQLKVEITTGYWTTHHLFGKQSQPTDKNLGNSSIESIIINAIIPTLFAYNRFHNTEDDCLDLIFDFYKTIKPESNTVVRKWEQSGIVPKNGLQTQGLMELYNNYCSKLECLRCHIGHKCIAG